MNCSCWYAFGALSIRVDLFYKKVCVICSDQMLTAFQNDRNVCTFLPHSFPAAYLASAVWQAGGRTHMQDSETEGGT